MWIKKLCNLPMDLEAGNYDDYTKGKDGRTMRWIKAKTMCMPNMEKERDKEFRLSSEDTVCSKVSVKEVFAATENLHQKNFIGEGTAGKVYRGKLPNKRHIAVKHIVNDGHDETFLREIQSVSHVRHPNLVKLLGYCEKGDQFFLIYELCPNGNLSQWIFGRDKSLSWIQRLHIAVDCARGLWFLHTYPEGCIVHRDIKPTNILIGKKFEAKLSDFGLSKVIDIGKSYATSEVRGTFGYVDPEYQNNNQVNPSGDVYSFGIVLLQIISGRRVINIDRKRPMSLNKMARSLSRHGNSITEFADPKLKGEYLLEAFDRIFKLALSCTSVKTNDGASCFDLGRGFSNISKGHKFYSWLFIRLSLHLHN